MGKTKVDSSKILNGEYIAGPMFETCMEWIVSLLKKDDIV